jgi:hypothetical protein
MRAHCVAAACPGPQALMWSVRARRLTAQRADPGANLDAERLGRAGLFGDRRVAQRIGWKAAVLALRSIKPGALDDFFSIGGHADDGHCHSGTSGF